MSDEREAQAGAPIEEAQASVNDVQAAVERAGEVGSSASDAAGEAVASPDTAAAAAEATAFDAPVADAAPAADSAASAETAVFNAPERPTVAFNEELPSAGPAAAVAAATTAYPTAAPTTPAPMTQQPMTQPYTQAPYDQAPTTVAPTMAMPMESPVRDGEIRISADHPMAALYMQSPMPPEIRGNRGAGVLIALLAAIGFGIVLIGVYALILAPQLPPSRFVDGLIDVVISWQMIFSVVAFFIGLVIVVLIVGRAGWWAYVLGGFLVALLTWVGAVVGNAVDAGGFDGLGNLSPNYFLSSTALLSLTAAFIVARETTIWFGAWIGSRGQSIKRSNANAITEYESALAEAQAPQS